MDESQNAIPTEPFCRIKYHRINHRQTAGRYQYIKEAAGIESARSFFAL